MIQSTSLWAKQHFSGAFTTDIRRNRRIVRIAERMARFPGKSIPQICETKYDIKAVYELLKHAESTPNAIQRGHRILTQETVQNTPGVYLLIEDSSDIIFSGRRQIQGLGPVGEADSVLKGFLLHTVLAVKYPPKSSSVDKYGKRLPVEIIGIADQQYYVREAAKKARKSRAFFTRDRESDLWLNSQKNIGQRLENENIKWISVCDRGADIYEYMIDSSNNNRNYIVRAKHDRILVPKTSNSKSLFEHARNMPESGTFELELRSRPGQAARTVILSLSYGTVEIRAPQRPGSAAGSLVPIKNTFIRVVEKNPISDNPLEWILLTDLKVNNFNEAYQIAEWYSSRWIIEDYHKALKSGMKIEELQLDTQHSLFAAISIMAVVALRLVELRETIRLRSTAPSFELGLDEIELLILKKVSKKNLKTIKEVGLAIGRLGGHIGRNSDGMPGMTTLWKGYIRLKDMSEGARLMRLQ